MKLRHRARISFGSRRATLRLVLIIPFLSVLLLVALPGCGTPAKRLRPYAGVPEIPNGGVGYSNTLQVQYLGVGGLLFRRGDDVVMTPPFYSNPHPLRHLPFIKSRPDTNQINRHFPPVSDVAAIVIGHAHYDHLMDLSHIVTSHATNAVVLGSTTAVNILAAGIPQTRLRAITNDAGVFQTGGRTGAWHHFRDNSVRIMALKSGHAPQFCNVMLFEGEVTEPLSKLPERLRDWKEGETFAYVIDFLKKDEIEFRIVYQDSAVDSPPYGGVPKGLENDRPPDLLIACVGSSMNVENYPMGVIDAWKPRNIIAAHWENFFRRYPDDLQDLRTLPLTDVGGFMQNLTNRYQSTPSFLAWPGAWLQFHPQE